MSTEAWTTRRVRDLTVLAAPSGHLVVVACDSVGGIGHKPHDSFQSDPRVATHFGVRVPVLEIIASGATPAIIVDTLSVEKDPTGEPLIEVVRAMAAELGLDPDLAVTGSTEDNVPTTATALGITVIGHADADDLTVGRACPGDHVIAVGTPMSAPEFTLTADDPRMPSIREVAVLTRIEGVHDTVPVGSHGIGYEIDQLARSAGLAAVPDGPGRLDRQVTAGPSTCVLIAIDPAAAHAVGQLRPDLPVEHVATLTNPNN